MSDRENTTPVPPDIRPILKRIKSSMPPVRDVAAFRAAGFMPSRTPQPPPGLAIEDRSIDGPGGPLPVRIYRPLEVKSPPVIVYFHGGGFVRGSLNSHDGVCRRLALGTDSVVVSVEYRLAPEHPFPAAIDDGFAAVRWAHDWGASTGADADRLVVAGDSAGATVAAGVALRCRDEGGPRLFLQILLVPMLRHRADTPTRRAFGQGDFGLTTELLNWLSDQWAPGAAADHPYASPLNAPDLSGLPPAYIHAAELDPLRDDGEEYAQRLRAAGVPVTYRMTRGLFHGFHLYAQALARAAAAVDGELGEIKGLLWGSPVPSHQDGGSR